jgi:hypothetical protein
VSEDAAPASEETEALEDVPDEEQA